MCGIAGIISKKEYKKNQYENISKMLNAIAHRGPDDEGIIEEENIILGHRRLSIIDLSDAGHQPMKYKHYTIVFNGEIYNFLEIKDILIQKGHTFKTQTDTEVLLHSYEEWGADCLNYLNGMWAFVIFDKKNNILFCARDRYGIKPFYYFNNQYAFLFASEIKGILAAGIKAQPNIDTLMAYLVVGFSDHTENTFFQDIYQLSPGYYGILDIKNGDFCTEQYYNLKDHINKSTDFNDSIEKLKSSIKLHLRSDVPVGTCLSGGIDSSIVAATASELIKNDLNTKFIAVTAQSEISEKDESGFAKEVVDHCDLEWHLVKPTYLDFSEHIEECLRIQEEPVGGPSVFMQYWVMKRAREAGVKVMLDGQGGDEIFLGYERYYPFYFKDLLINFKWFLFIKEYFLASKHSKLSMKELTAYTLYFTVMSLRKKRLSSRLSFLRKHYLELGLNALKKNKSEITNVYDLQALELTKTNLPHLLHYEDRNSMAHSIEARVPFVEHQTIEAGLTLKTKDKIRNGYTKYSLRKYAEEILPKSIAWRRTKIGFEAPDKLWISKHMLIMQEKVDNSKVLNLICEKVPQLNQLPLNISWRLYNIAVWEEQYLVS